MPAGGIGGCAVGMETPAQHFMGRAGKDIRSESCVECVIDIALVIDRALRILLTVCVKMDGIGLCDPLCGVAGILAIHCNGSLRDALSKVRIIRIARSPAVKGIAVSAGSCRQRILLTGANALDLLLAVVCEDTFAGVEGHSDSVLVCPDGVQGHRSIGGIHHSVFQRLVDLRTGSIACGICGPIKAPAQHFVGRAGKDFCGQLHVRCVIDVLDWIHRAGGVRTVFFKVDAVGICSPLGRVMHCLTFLDRISLFRVGGQVLIGIIVRLPAFKGIACAGNSAGNGGCKAGSGGRILDAGGVVIPDAVTGSEGHLHRSFLSPLCEVSSIGVREHGRRRDLSAIGRCGPPAGEVEADAVLDRGQCQGRSGLAGLSCCAAIRQLAAIGLGIKGDRHICNRLVLPDGIECHGIVN